MTWDITKPQGNESISLGAFRIRELKEDLENILTKEHHFPVSTTYPQAYHKFSLLTTSQEGNTRNGQIWYNTQTKQLSYKVAGVIKRCARYIQQGFTMLVLKMPSSASSYWQLRVMQNDYAVGVSNNIFVHTGQSMWEFTHTHTLASTSVSHTHSITYEIQGASGNKEGISMGSGSKWYSVGYDGGWHHKEEDGSRIKTVSITHTLSHTHTIGTHTFSPRYYECFVVERR